jgi:endonuclease/exonuclease/phosphatase (EEP) superfamily protein YafD
MGETTQPAPETDEKKSRGLGSYLVWAFVVVMAYVLSIGPVLKLCYRGVLSPKVLIIYKPLDLLCTRNALTQPMVRYLEFWCPEVKNGPPKK